MELLTLKNEVLQVLDRYQIPLDDKSFILEKIDGGVASMAQAVGNQIQIERDQVKAKMDELAQKANQGIATTLHKAQDSVHKAYDMGLKEGADKVNASSGPSFIQIAMIVGGVALIGLIIYKEFFSGRN